MVTKLKDRTSFQLAKLKCKESVIAYGRNESGEPDVCFDVGKEYLFCVDNEAGDIFTVDDVGEVHFLTLNSYFTDKHFDIIAINNANQFDLDELTLKRMECLNKEKYEYQD